MGRGDLSVDLGLSLAEWLKMAMQMTYRFVYFYLLSSPHFQHVVNSL